MENSLQNILEEWANKLTNLYKSKIGEETDIAKSIKSEIYFDGNNFIIEINLNEYWKWIENGRAPGKQPPIEAMVKLAKKVVPRPYILPSGKQTIPSEKQLAFLIGRKIGRDGVKPRPYLKESIDEIKGELFKDITDEIVTKIRQEIIK